MALEAHGPDSGTGSEARHPRRRRLSSRRSSRSSCRRSLLSGARPRSKATATTPTATTIASRPYGYDGLSSELQQARTVVNSTLVGNQTYANAVPIYRGQLVVRCRPALACEHARCATGLVCVDSKRYPGRRVCALP